jgi:hypothetical protein
LGSDTQRSIDSPTSDIIDVTMVTFCRNAQREHDMPQDDAP